MDDGVRRRVIGIDDFASFLFLFFWHKIGKTPHVNVTMESFLLFCSHSDSVAINAKFPFLRLRCGWYTHIDHISCKQYQVYKHAWRLQYR
jgi:hypothetical protein